MDAKRPSKNRVIGMEEVRPCQASCWETGAHTQEICHKLDSKANIHLLLLYVDDTLA